MDYKKLNNDELSKIYNAGNELVSLIMMTSDEDISDLKDNVRDGLPIGINVEFEDGRISEIDVMLGHADGYEWHGCGDSIEILRAQEHKLLKMMTDHIDIAIENHLDVIRDQEAYA